MDCERHEDAAEKAMGSGRDRNVDLSFGRTRSSPHTLLLARQPRGVE